MSIRKLPSYLARLGLIQGVRNYWAAEGAGLNREGAASKRYVVPYLQSSVWLRHTRSDHATFFQVMIKRQYDMSGFPQYADLRACYEREVSAGRNPLIIDAGANIGLSAVWFATQFPKAHIVAVEPDANNLRMLRLNIEPFKERVTVVEGGVWPRRAALRIVNPDSGSAAFQLREVQEGEASDHALKAWGIDDLCAMMGGADPLMVKLDIEGAQAYLFSENTGWVQRAGCISLELDDWLMPWQGTSRNFFRALAPLEFDYLLGDESIFCFNAARLIPQPPVV